MSATYKCSKCGLEGWSKNIRTRSLFTNDQISSIMTQLCNVITEVPPEGEYRRVTFEFPHMERPEWKDAPNETLEREACNLIRELTPEQLTHWLCDHSWEHVSGKEL